MNLQRLAVYGYIASVVLGCILGSYYPAVLPLVFWVWVSPLFVIGIVAIYFLMVKPNETNHHRRDVE